MKDSLPSPKILGFSQASSIVVYCGLVTLFFWKIEEIFGQGTPEYLAPIVMLLLLSFSVLICALAVFYKPYKLFVAGKKNQAAETVLYTAGWLLGYFLLLILLLSGGVAS